VLCNAYDYKNISPYDAFTIYINGLRDVVSLLRGYVRLLNRDFYYLFYLLLGNLSATSEFI
jgi:hypothetical protein